MEDYQSYQIPQRGQNNGLIKFIFIGFLEILFILTLLSLILGTLNYFSIINLSKIIPQLSILPKNSITTPIYTSSPAAQDRNQLLYAYINTTLLPQYQPSQATDKPLITTNQNTISIKWHRNDDIFNAYALTSLNGNPTKYAIEIINNNGPSTTSATIDKTMVNLLLKKYFIKPQVGSFTCSLNQKIFYSCESFITTRNKKIGFIIYKPYRFLESKTVNISTCNIFPTNLNYSIINSCLNK